MGGFSQCASPNITSNVPTINILHQYDAFVIIKEPITGKNRIWQHVWSVSLILALCCCCYYNHWKDAVYRCKHMQWPVLRKLSFCLNIKIKCLCSAYRKTFWSWPPVNCCRKEEISTFFPQCLPSQEIFSKTSGLFMGFPGNACGKEPTCQCRKLKRHGFDPWVGKIPWRRHATHSSTLVWRILSTKKPGGP